jgi:hypothetical protein
MTLTINELHQHIVKNIQGVFSESDMQILKTEIEKLKPGEVYVEVGVDEGRSARTSFEYADPGVIKIWIDINNVDPIPSYSIGRGAWMQKEKMVGLNINNFFVHGDNKEFAKIFNLPVALIFIDGFHNYDSVKGDTLIWEPKIKPGGVMLFHDYDHPETKQWLDEHFGDNKQNVNGKIIKVQK